MPETVPGKEALEAAAKAEYEFNHPTRKWEDAHWADRKVLTDAAEVILTAALPYLREQIAQELLDARPAVQARQVGKTLRLELEYAARIVRGEA